MDGSPEEKLEAERIKRIVKKNRQRRRRNGSTSEVIVPNSGREEGPITNQAATVASSWTKQNFDKSSINNDAMPVDMESGATFSPKSDCLGKDKTAADSFYKHNPTSTTFTCLQCGLLNISDSQNDNEANLLMHYLDVVFPLLFRFYNPLVSEGGRGWLLMILLRTKPLFHAALSLSAYHAQKMSISAEMDASNDLLSELMRHHILTLAELRVHINRLGTSDGNMTKQTQVEVLACVIHLISFEVSIQNI